MMGINSDSGGPPFFRPSAFWWKQPDGRRLFVYLNLSYPDGYDFFETAHWRRGPVPAASDTALSAPPRRRLLPHRRNLPPRRPRAVLAADRRAPQGRLPLQRSHDLHDEPLADGQRPAIPPLAAVRCGLERTAPEAGAGLHDRVESCRGNGEGRGRPRRRSIAASSPTGGPTAPPPVRGRSPPVGVPSEHWLPCSRPCGARLTRQHARRAMRCTRTSASSTSTPGARV